MTCLFVVEKLVDFKCSLQTLNSFFDILSGADNKTEEEEEQFREEEKL